MKIDTNGVVTFTSPQPIGVVFKTTSTSYGAMNVYKDIQELQEEPLVLILLQCISVVKETQTLYYRLVDKPVYFVMKAVEMLLLKELLSMVRSSK